MGNAKDNGGNGRSARRFAPEQVEAFRKMICLPKILRREVLDMVVLFELVEHDSARVAAIKEALSAPST